LATSVENDCNYCTAAHSTIAQSFLHTSSKVVAAVLNGQPVPDTKLNALVALVTEIVRQRGNVKDETLQKFIAVGYKKEQVMELLLGIALKTISNYLDHICPTTIDQVFMAATE
jgi:alkylhydroperoxidase family enzyme